MRIWALLLVAAGCGKADKDAGRQDPPKTPAVAVPADAAEAAPAPIASEVYPDLGTALKATIPADARVLGFGELHVRTDRKQVTSTLKRFTAEAIPALGDKMSDLIIETWINDPKCGAKAETATARVQTSVRRPVETKSDIGILADTAKAAKIQPHAMKLKCDDYDKFAPKDGEFDPAPLLLLTTQELTRIAGEAVGHRTKMGDKRPWVALYGGALHNDRFPAAGVEEWSYAAAVDAGTSDKYVELDLIVPEIAEGDDSLKKQPWFQLVAAADDKVHVYKRGDRSFVFVLPKGK